MNAGEQVVIGRKVRDEMLCTGAFTFPKSNRKVKVIKYRGVRG